MKLSAIQHIAVQVLENLKLQREHSIGGMQCSAHAARLSLDPVRWKLKAEQPCLALEPLESRVTGLLGHS